MKKRKLTFPLAVLGILVLMCAWVFSSWAVDYPMRQITLLCGYGAGGGNDILGRAVASALEPLLGQPVVVSNKPGASGTIAMGVLASSKPDGYTIAVTPGSFAVTPSLQQVPYDITKDFTYLAALGTYMEAISVRSDSPWKKLENLIGYARQNPNQVKIGVAGIVSSMGIMVKIVGQKEGVQWTLIPFKSDAEVITALLGGHINVGVTVGGQAPHVKAGTLRMLAITTSERVMDYPDVPTLMDRGYNFVTLTLCGMVGPKGLPEPIVQKLEEALVKVKKDPVYMSTIKSIYIYPSQEMGKDYEKRVLKINTNMDEYLKIK